MNRSAGLLGLLLTVMGTAMQADDHPNTGRGFAADKVFQAGDLDNVNLFNGNLTLTIPIGGSYPAGGSLSYSLSLIYNSNVWDFQERFDVSTGSTYTQALPQRTQNAGLGWLLTLGRLYAPVTPPNDSERWLYQGPDGAEHAFYEVLHAGDLDEPGDTPTSQTVTYTRDGSYLRMKVVNGLREIEFPDGQVHHFDNALRVDKISDRFGNALNVEYNFLVWKLTDTRGRTHRVYFHNEVQDGTNILVVERIELAAFGAFGPAHYTFGYTTAPIARGCPDTDEDVTPSTAEVPLLTSITLPDGSSYQMLVSDYVSELNLDPFLCRSAGALRGLKLPTFGRLEWTYGKYSFPAVGKIHRQFSNGVLTRKAVGTPTGIWNYSTSLTGAIGNQQLKNTVTDPLGHRTERYFVALAQNVQYSLPYTHVTSLNGRYLSSQVFDASGALKRTAYVLYEWDEVPVWRDEQELMNVNRRELSSRMVFDDDGKYAEVTRSGFDGMGHYRVEATGGNFNAGDSRTTTTAFNPLRKTYKINPATNLPAGEHDFTMWPSNAKWVLETFDSRKVEEGTIAFSEYCFDAETGFLQRQRTLKNAGTGKDASDLLVVYVPGDTATDLGNVKSERYFGGDTQSIDAVSSICNVGLPAPAYQIDHTYQAGARATSQYVGTSFLSLDLTIDGPSGLPSSSRDSAGVQTSYEYDPQGRLMWVKPVGGDGYTQYTYAQATTNAFADVLIRRRGAGEAATVLAQSQVFFDGFGRVRQEKQLLPSGQWSVRETTYDSAGHRKSVSALQTGTPNRTTQFLEYDAFGRAHRIRPPDGATHDVTVDYFGTRVVERTVNIRTAAGIETPVKTTETYDRQGRLSKVAERSGTAGAVVTTDYSYDVGSRLNHVQTTANGTTQNRYFNYDNRGFLGSETHPEKGTGNGTVSYSLYDARGHAGRKVDGPNDLTFVYDAAERLVTVKETGANPARPLKSFSYASSNAGGNLRKGKLESATRYNFPFLPVLTPKVTVSETYTYAGRQGRVSKKTTQMLWDGGTGAGDEPKEAFEQSYTYNVLGDVDHIDYPVCTFAPSCPPTATYPRGVNFSYTNGALTSVSDFISNITYHPNGLAYQVTHANGVIDTQANDPNSMPRPASLSAGVAGLSPQLWSSGTYTYDGAGNIASLGTGSFLYDQVSRVVDAHVYDGPTGGGTLRSQSYTYDPFGNLTAIGGDALAGGRNMPVNAQTNRLIGTNVQYDGAGNQTQGASPSGSCTTGNPCYDYDRFGMMIHMLNSGEEWRYVYTADDERFWAYRFNGQPPGVHSVWTLRDLDGKVLREYDPPNLPPRDYVYRGSQLAASSVAGEGDRHISLDHLGTPRLVTAPGGYTRATWTGASGNCVPAAADYDGDGDADLSLKCGPAWHFYNDDGSYLKGIWTGGQDSDIPAPADYDGDGDDDVVAFNGGAWSFFDYATGAYHGVWTGAPGNCVPAPADYDGDQNHDAELSLKCGPAWHFYNDNGSYIKGIWTGGPSSELPVPGDYDGDGRDDVVAFNAGAWNFFDHFSGAYVRGVWTGVSGTMRPAPMDYDGDGTTDFTIYADGLWHLFKDDGAYLQGLWTATGATPVPGNFGGDLTDEPAIFSGGAWSIYSFAGMPVSRHAYFPFGDEITPTNQDRERAKFTGHQRDLANPASMADDLDYMHARHYNPLRARFLQPDPASRRGAPPSSQLWNRYAYTANRPMWAIDRSGRDIYPPPALEGAIRAALVASPRARAIYTQAEGPQYYIRFGHKDPRSKYAAYSEFGFSTTGRLVSKVFYDPSLDSRAAAGNLSAGDVATIFHEIYHALEMYMYSAIWTSTDINAITKRMEKLGIGRRSGSGMVETPGAAEVTATVGSELRIYSPDQVDFSDVPIAELFEQPFILEGIYLDLRSPR